MINKITAGFVIQTFNDTGLFLQQEFIAGDQCDYEDEDGQPLDIKEIGGDIYHPFNMLNPDKL